jgi:hypothetical protein
MADKILQVYILDRFSDIYFCTHYIAMPSEAEAEVEVVSDDLHGMVPDTNDTVLVLIDVINHLDFEGNEGLIN